MEKYGTAGQATDDSIIRRTRFACWITIVTHTDPEYVIFIGFPRQKWLSERASMLRLYAYCLSCTPILPQFLLPEQSEGKITYNLNT